MNKTELYKFLSDNITGCGAYFLITYNGKTEATYISRYINWCEDGSDWFLESPCQLIKFEFEDNSDESIREYVKEMYYEDAQDEMFEYTKSMIFDGYLHEVYNGQCSPYLPEIIDSIELITEMECLQYLLSENESK